MNAPLPTPRDNRKHSINLIHCRQIWINRGKWLMSSFWCHSREARKKIMSTILENVGNTPLVRLNSVPKSFGIKCEIREFHSKYSIKWIGSFNDWLLFQWSSVNFSTPVEVSRIELACGWSKMRRKPELLSQAIAWSNPLPEIPVSRHFLLPFQLPIYFRCNATHFSCISKTSFPFINLGFSTWIVDCD